MPKPGYVYTLASGYNGTLYIGVTNDLLRRAWEHRHGVTEGFTKRYGVHRLVYYEAFQDEAFQDIRDALVRSCG